MCLDFSSRNPMNVVSCPLAFVAGRAVSLVPYSPMVWEWSYTCHPRPQVGSNCTGSF